MESFRKAFADPIKKEKMYERNRNWHQRNRAKASLISTTWNFFHRNGIIKPSQEEKEIYQWLHAIKKERPKGKSREMRNDDVTLEKKLQALYQRLVSKAPLKSFTRTRRRSAT